MKRIEILLLGIGILILIFHFTPEVSIHRGNPELVKRTKNAQSLLTYLALYSQDHSGVYPACLSDLAIEQEFRSSMLYWQDTTNRPIPMHYIVGLTDGSSGDTPIIASPRSIDGKRIVGHLDGSASNVSEEDWQTLLKTTLEDPKLSLRTTFKTP